MSKSFSQTYNIGSSSADDLRTRGWLVAVHNDYRKDGRLMTFWLFTCSNFYVKGEAETDVAALDHCRLHAYLLDHDIASEEAEQEHDVAEIVKMQLDWIVKHAGE